MLNVKMVWKRTRGGPKTKWMDQIRKDIEMRGKNWEETQDNRKWENRDSWRFLCNSQPISLETWMMIRHHKERKYYSADIMKIGIKRG